MNHQQQNHPWLRRALIGMALACATSLLQAQSAEDYVVSQFDDGTVQGWAYNYGNAVCTVEHDPNENRGPGTPGALKITVPFDLCTLGGGNQTDFEAVLGQVLDLTKYTRLHFSIKVDPSSSRLSDWGGGAFGGLRPHIRLANWSGDSNLGSNPDNVWVGTDAYGNWVDYTYTIDQTLANEPTRLATGILGFDMWSGWGTCAAPIGHTNTVIFWIDNIWFELNTNTAPPPPPTLAIKKAGPSGVKITVDTDGDQWQRDAIVTPADAGSVMWAGYGANPVTYSFTLADYPDPVVHEGFETHLYIINRDTQGGTGNETYGGADWNVPDIAIVSLQALANGQFECQFQWKTNLPNANPPEDPVHRPAYLYSPTALGTWSLTFTHDTNVTLSGPGGISTNFTIPLEAVQNNFSPAGSYLQFGFHKNDNENDGHNNQVSGTFSRVRKQGGAFQFDDTFDGPTLTNNYAWRKTSQSAVQHVPPGTSWLLDWTLPATGYSPVSAASITGPWADAGATSVYQSGGKVHAMIPSAALPSADSTYFRLLKREFTKLQILLPGETAAPGTLTGKTGTPTAQTAGVPFFITVRSVDDDWYPVGSSHVVSIAANPDDANFIFDQTQKNLVSGVVTFEAAPFGVGAGSYTFTTTNVTDNTKAPATSPSVTIN